MRLWPWKKEVPAGNRDTGETGEWGEAVAEKVLRGKGYRILGRRVRIGRHDELDIVARDGEELVFVEVKTRARENFGRPAAAVDREKRHRMSRAAVRYIKETRVKKVCFRFDIVEVIVGGDPENPRTRHIINAFTLDRCYTLP